MKSMLSFLRLKGETHSELLEMGLYLKTSQAR